MKRLVLSEGKRDVLFVETFFRITDGDHQIDTFHAGNLSGGELKGEESRKIRSFAERRNPYEVLAKSEGGKPNLMRIFTKLIRNLAGRDIEVVLLVDLDGRPLSALFDELDEKVRGNYDGAEYRVEMVDEMLGTSEIVAAEAQLSAENGSTLCSFDVLAFTNNLEAAAGIPSVEQSDKERIESFLCERESVRRVMGMAIL